jgi:phosphocarrier protein HPr
MVTKDFVVKNATGLHARPATLLAKKAAQFKSDVSIQNGDKVVNAKSLIGILSLGAGKGANLKLVINGADEEVALTEIVKFLDEITE